MGNNSRWLQDQRSLCEVELHRTTRYKKRRQSWKAAALTTTAALTRFVGSYRCCLLTMCSSTVRGNVSYVILCPTTVLFRRNRTKASVVTGDGENTNTGGNEYTDSTRLYRAPSIEAFVDTRISPEIHAPQRLYDRRCTERRHASAQRVPSCTRDEESAGTIFFF